MESAGSPPRSAGNPSSSRNSLNGGPEVLAKRHSRSWEIDDSSSITSTSMSSTSRNRPARCHVCKDAHTTSKPLFKCSRCSGRWHSCCHKPEIPRDIEATFMCQRCKKKTETNPAPAGSPTMPTSGTMPPPAPATSNSPVASQTPLVRRCEKPECQKMPLRELVDGKILCKFHSIEHKLNTRPSQPIAKPTSAPKPFKKSDLYHIKPEDKIYLKKRKRGSSSNRGSSASHSRTHSRESNLSNVGQGRRVASMQASIASSKSPPTNRAPQSIAEVVAARQTKQGLPKSISDNSLSSLSSLPDVDALLRSQMRMPESPDYEPPSPKLSAGDPWPEKDIQVDKPEIQTTTRLPVARKTAFPPKLSEDASSYVSPYLKGSPHFEAETSPSIGEPVARSNTLDHSDDEMPDPEPLTLNTSTADLQSPTPTPTPSDETPVEDAATAITPDVKEPELEADQTVDKSEPSLEKTAANDSVEVSSNRPNPKSIAARLKPEDYDPSILDAFIKKQSEPKSDHEPTEKELLETQIWGHIDPRVAWPKEYSEEWYEAKKVEIAKRPSRKQRFGKVRKQQPRNPLPDEIIAEMEKFSKDLFGIEYAADFEPGVRDGVLVMIEQNDTNDPVTGEPRSKNAKELKVYRVG